MARAGLRRLSVTWCFGGICLAFPWPCDTLHSQIARSATARKNSPVDRVFEVVNYRFCEFELDTDCYELRKQGRSIGLARRPFDVLLCLIERRSRVVLRRELVDVVWQGCCVSDATLSHCILELRRILSDDADRPRFLRTVRGRGYRFVAPLTMAPFSTVASAAQEAGAGAAVATGVQADEL